MWFKKRKEETNPNGYFTQTWMAQWKENINGNNQFKKHGKFWNTPIILNIENSSIQKESQSETGVYLDLKDGKCSDIRYATTDDRLSASTILKADEKTWIKLIESDGDPTKLIMLGRIKLEKGSLVLLSTQRLAAAELIKSAPSENQKKSNYSINESKAKNHIKRESFKSTNKGIDHNSFPMKLFQKAKRYGVWNPTDINLSIDIKQWEQLSEDEKEIIIHLVSLFLAGEEAVTSDLLPLIKAISNEGKLEEELYLTSFLWEEAKHVEFFSIYKQQVLKEFTSTDKYHGPFYKIIFYQKLPHALTLLDENPSPANQLKAAITYNMIVEGTLAETGYAAFYNMLEEQDLLPGLREGINKLKQDESRHIAFGLYLIQRILNENPNLMEIAENELTTLLDDATNIIHEIFEPYETIPFNLEKEWFLNYAIKQFQMRVEKLGLSM